MAATTPTDLAEHAESFIKIICVMGTIIGGLVVYAWHEMKNRGEKTEELLAEHVENDEKIHHELYTKIEDVNGRLERLIGAHEVNHKTKVQ